jgi:hypothetical protein
MLVDTLHCAFVGTDIVLRLYVTYSNKLVCVCKYIHTRHIELNIVTSQEVFNVQRQFLDSFEFHVNYKTATIFPQMLIGSK